MNFDFSGLERIKEGINLFNSTKTYSVTKKDIKSLPFDALGRDCQASYPDYTHVVEQFAATHNIKKVNWSWIYPQIIASIGKWAPVKDSSGKVNGKETIRKALSGSDFNKGIYFFSMINSRYLDKQYMAGRSEYCALVPLIMSAFKKMQGIKYNDWTDIKWVASPNLVAAMTCSIPEYTTDELLQFRVRGIKQGGNPTNSYGIYHLSEPFTRDDGTEVPGVGSLPALARMMILQTWCAHPSNRNAYMVLDPTDWDKMPEPLVADESRAVLPTEEELPWDTAPDKKPASELPWDA